MSIKDLYQDSMDFALSESGMDEAPTDSVLLQWEFEGGVMKKVPVILDENVLNFEQERLANQVEVTVSKTHVPEVNLGVHKIYIPNSEPKEPPNEYILKEIITEDCASFTLRFAQ